MTDLYLESASLILGEITKLAEENGDVDCLSHKWVASHGGVLDIVYKCRCGMELVVQRYFYSYEILPRDSDMKCKYTTEEHAVADIVE